MTDYDEKLLLTKKQLATVFGVSDRSIANWDIHPAGQKGRAKLYYLPEVMTYKLDSLQKSGTASFELTEERARLTHHQANLAELQEDKERGDLMSNPRSG